MVNNGLATVRRCERRSCLRSLQCSLVLHLVLHLPLRDLLQPTTLDTPASHCHCHYRRHNDVALRQVHRQPATSFRLQQWRLRVCKLGMMTTAGQAPTLAPLLWRQTSNRSGTHTVMMVVVMVVAAAAAAVVVTATPTRLPRRHSLVLDLLPRVEASGTKLIGI